MYFLCIKIHSLVITICSYKFLQDFSNVFLQVTIYESTFLYGLKSVLSRGQQSMTLSFSIIWYQKLLFYNFKCSFRIISKNVLLNKMVYLSFYMVQMIHTKSIIIIEISTCFIVGVSWTNVLFIQYQIFRSSHIKVLFIQDLSFFAVGSIKTSRFN